MKLLDYMARYGYEQLVLCHDDGIGLKAIIAIHDTTLGPALGGIRLWNYDSEEGAILDALRLARAMTYKSAAAGLNLGGGKAVVLGPCPPNMREAYFRSLGSFIDSLSGRYIATEDVGTYTQDMEYLKTQTPYVTGLPINMGGSGDPSVLTGWGVYWAMKACCQEVFGSDSLAHRKIALQGVGKVGSYLARHLVEEGAHLWATDINPEAAQRAKKEFGAQLVSPEEIYDVEADIFSPNALGGVLNSRTIPRIKSPIVCGAANNQLLEEADGERLMEGGLVYAPDFIVNAGGVINIALEFNDSGYNEALAREKVQAIYLTTKRVLAKAKAEGIITSLAADRLAEERLKAVKAQKKIYQGE